MLPSREEYSSVLQVVECVSANRCSRLCLPAAAVAVHVAVDLERRHAGRLNVVRVGHGFWVSCLDVLAARAWIVLTAHRWRHTQPV